MSYEEMLAQQFIAFHTVIVDSCGRSNRPRQTDAMVLRLRSNALAMAKLQLTLLPLVRDVDAQAPCNAVIPPKAKRAPQPEPIPEPEPLLAPLMDPEPDVWAEPEPLPTPESPPEAVDAEPPAHAVEPAQDHVLSGDALSRFVSRRIDPAESAYQAWQHSLREAASGLRRDATQRSLTADRLPNIGHLM